METILRGLSAGFIVGVFCVGYVIFRIWRVQRKLEASGINMLEDDKLGNNWLLMAFVASSSIVWGFLGAGIYYLVKSHFYFILFSLCLAFMLSAILFFKDTYFKSDKIVLTLIITIGLGFLIPYLI